MSSTELAKQIGIFGNLWEKWLDATPGIGLKAFDSLLGKLNQEGDFSALKTALSARKLPEVPPPIYKQGIIVMDTKACLAVRKKFIHDKQSVRPFMA